jgi:hypothetical protein
VRVVNRLKGAARDPPHLDADLVVSTAARAAPERGDLDGYGTAGTADQTSD